MNRRVSFRDFAQALRDNGQFLLPWEGTDRLLQRMMIHLKLFSSFIVLMLAAALLGCEAATPERMTGAAATPTDSAGTSAPAPMSGVVPETGTDALLKQGKSKYPNLDVYLNKLAARFEKGQEYGKPAVEGDSAHDSTVVVRVLSSSDVNAITTWLENNGIKDKVHSSDDVNAIATWLGNNGIKNMGCSLDPLSFCVSRRSAGGSYVITVIPVHLLVSLSQQPDVSFVSAMKPYPKLSYYLRNLALEFDEGPRYYKDQISPVADLKHPDSYGHICMTHNPDPVVRLANLEAIIAWLEDNGIYRYWVGNGWIRSEHPDASSDGFLRLDSVEARVPVRLLGDLSLQQGISTVGVSGCASNDGGPRPCGDPCMEEGFATIRGIGQSATFILSTNADNPPGVQVDVNDQGDKGKLAIGSCSNDISNEVSLGHTDSITIVGCSPGGAHVSLYKGDNLLGKHKISVIGMANRPPSPAELSPDPSAMPSMKVGQSRTFILNTRIPNPPGVMVSVNTEDWYPGNLAMGNCPGAEDEGVVIDNGDTVTITACAPGRAALHVLYLGNIPDNDLVPGLTGDTLMGYTIWVWGE